MTLAGRRVLVTGHTGFKGAWLCLWLHQQGARVSGLARGSTTGPTLYGRAQLGDLLDNDLRGDVRDAGTVRQAVEHTRPELVLHLAGQPLVRASYEDPVGTVATNVMGTLHVLDAVRRAHRPCPVVVVTSDKVYAEAGRVGGNREDDPLGGRDPYSASKAAVELVTASFQASFGDRLLRIATVRAGNVLGGGDWAADRLIPDALRALESGRPIQVRNPASVRPWQHVLEPLRGYLMVAESLLDEEVSSAARAWNFGPRAQHISSAAVVEGLIGHWGSGSWVSTADASAPAESPALTLCADDAGSLLGWTPRWTLDECVGRIVGWQRSVSIDAPPAAVRSACLADIAAYERVLSTA